MGNIRPLIKFPLGQVLCTPGILESVCQEDILEALIRHQAGDWGNVCEEDAGENQLALEQGFRLLSVYCSQNKIKFWIITEADRKTTTILLPEEY